MKDFFGGDISEGDTVAVAITHYAELVKGTVTGFTPKRVNVDIVRQRWDGNPIFSGGDGSFKYVDVVDSMNVDPERLVVKR